MNGRRRSYRIVRRAAPTRRPASWLLVAAAALAVAACARPPAPPRQATAYPDQPVQTVVGTGYAAYPGLPAPPADRRGRVPPPPPRYMGSSAEASSANVSAR